MTRIDKPFLAAAGGPVSVNQEREAGQPIETTGSQDRSPKSDTAASAESKIDRREVQECFYLNEVGDGILFAIIHSEKFIFDYRSAEWLVWQGHHWELDIGGAALAAVEDVALVFDAERDTLAKEIEDIETVKSATTTGSGKQKDLRVIQIIKKKEAYEKRSRRLRTSRGRRNCLEFAAANLYRSLGVDGEDFDQQALKLACPNGVIDLETGLCIPGRQSDLLTKTTGCLWTGFETPAPLWDRTLLEIFDDNQVVVDYVRRLLGYCITGLVTEHVFPIFQGRGRNGKTMILDIVGKVLGDFSTVIKPELLLNTGPRSSGAPSPDIMALRGTRLVVAEETDEFARFSGSRVKALSGGGKLCGRAPHDKRETNFAPTHKIILLTNDRPKANGADYAFWARVQLLMFNKSFVVNPQRDFERQKDEARGQQIIETELPGVLAWLVRGCLEWQRDGLRPPAEVLDATEQYQADEDIVGLFARRCLVPAGPEDKVSAGTAYEIFSTWFQETQGRKVPSRNTFGRGMVARYERREISGCRYYFGIDFNHGAAAPFWEQGENRHHS